MDSLVAAGYSTYALDQRGYGETKRDQTGWLTPNKASADLSEVLRWVRARTNRVPALLGWSYGSMVSHLCVQRDASLVFALILYGYPRAIDSQYRLGAGTEVAPLRKVTTAEAAADDFIAGEAVSRAMVKAFVKQALLSDPVRVDWRNKDQFSELDPRKLQVPTLLIHGALDPYAPRAAQQKIYDALPHSRKRWVVLEGGDHAAHLEATRFVHELVRFLQGQEPAHAPEVALLPEVASPIDAGLVATTTSDAHDAAQSSGVHFVLGDWSGSLSERRVRSALRRVNKKLWACASKHDGYGSYEISYHLNASSVARKTLKQWKWVYPIKVSAMQASSDRAIQCINYALSQQNHFMRKYKQARVSGTLSIIK